jgi:hypothetical protein
MDDYNKIEFKDLNCKITNEAIEEVEEAKEVSELRQSSDFYNNMSNLKSSRKELKTCSNRNIIPNKTKNQIQKKSINRCLTLENKDILRKDEKIISKIKKKKENKKNSLYINVLSSNSLISKNNKHLKIIPPFHSNNYLDLKNNNYKRNNKLIYLIKKNFGSTKPNDCNNNFLCLNSDTTKNKNSHKAYFKKIPNNYLKENINNRIKQIKYIRKKNLIKKHIETNNEIYEKSSKTMPNLKKKFDYSKIDKNEINEYTLNLNKKRNDFKNESIKKIKETNYYKEKQILKTMRIDENKKKGKLINRYNNIYHYKYLKDFYPEDRIKTFNKSNDKLDIHTPLNNQLFSQDDMKIKMNKKKLVEDKYQKLFKEFHIRNRNKDSLNKKTNNFIKHHSHSKYIIRK